MKKYLLTTLLILAFCMTFAACVEDEKVDGNEEISSDAKVQEDTTDDVVNEETTTSEDAETDTKVSDEETITDNEEVNASDESAVEMVDFETWATQADNEEVCMVVWNEKTGTQKILPSVFESKKVYEINEGDRFALPFKNNITYVMTEDSSEVYKECKFENSKYLEFSLSVGEVMTIYVGYTDKNAETIHLTYLFK